MSSSELTEWMLLYAIEDEEREYQKLVLESGDGQVVISGRDDPHDDHEEEDEGA